MTIRMLIDASHEEETRVAVIHGNRVEEFDYESSAKKQIKGNVYLAKVTRVEPSLQAAFVDYGGNRHGFLAFSEIHPDYYQIPVSDREALISEETAAYASMLEEEEKFAERKEKSRKRDKSKFAKNKSAAKETGDISECETIDSSEEDSQTDKAPATIAENVTVSDSVSEEILPESEAPATDEISEINPEADTEGEEEPGYSDDDSDAIDSQIIDDEDAEEKLRIKIAKGLRRKYKIQEVIKKNQILLIQVVKEERGNKGAALTTYLSLPGRYCVLMPNTLHGGGVSRKIANASERKSLKQILAGLDMPTGIACIIRTAGNSRTKTEIKRDFDYLIRTWEGIRDRTLKSVAPVLINEEGDLIKRSIRDLYTREVDEILVEGEEGYKTARNFMRLLMPSHARKIKHYTDPIPLLHKYQVESQLDSMFSPIVQLKSGGYIVINPTEALVSIDVNSGKATKEHNIEETARKTNLEAAEEVARQLRLRDMAGLIVIDFIDMEVRGNNRSVEQKLKECLKSDRARIQVGSISSFGLLEMSRQRLRSGMLESSTIICPHCEGAGVIRSIETQVLHILRSLEEEGIKGRNNKIVLKLPEITALYIINNKRTQLVNMEAQYNFTVEVVIDKSLTDSGYKLELANIDSRASEKTEDSRQTRSSSSDHRDDRDRNKSKMDRSGSSRPKSQDSQPVTGEAQVRAGQSDSEIEPKATNEGTRSPHNAAAPEGQENKSRRRRRSRRNNRDRNVDINPDNKEVQTTPSVTVADNSGEKETAASEITPSTDATPPAASDEKPKRRRRVRGRKNPEDRNIDQAATTEVKAVEVEVEVEVEPAAPKETSSTDKNVPAAESGEKKPTRRPYPPQARSRRKVAEGQKSVDTVSPAAADKVSEPKESKPSPKKTNLEVKADKPETKKSETEKPAEKKPESNQPKKTGWWQRTFG